MRPIIGVHGDCLWSCGDVCHSPTSLSAPRSHGKLRSMLTGTGVGSNFRFVSHLDAEAATRPDYGVCSGVRSLLLCIWGGGSADIRRSDCESERECPIPTLRGSVLCTDHDL